MTLPFNATRHIWQDGTELLDAAARTGLDAPVASCDGWTMGDLVWHVAGVWSFWGQIVAELITDEADIRLITRANRPADDVLIEFARAGHTALHAAVTNTPPDTEIWTWTGGNRDVWWVRRRMAHETAVHRWDAELTVGDAYHVPVDLATDGIDEFLMWFAARGRTEPLGGTVHIHCTDETSAGTSGEWMVHQLGPDGIELERTHAKGDTAIRGEAQALLLWLWGRDGGPVEILGDADLAARFRDDSRK